MASPEVKFALRLASDAGRGVAALLAGIGDRLGLFSALAKGPASPEDLAQRTSIHPRYAREWLHAMAAAGYVDHRDGKYELPPPQAEVLAHEGGGVFMGGTLQMLLGMIATMPWLREAFVTGKGIPADAYPPDAWEGMERDMAGLYETQLVSEWLPRVPAVRGLLQGGGLVADIGCGRGRAIFTLAKAFPNARFVGYDVHPPNVEAAQRKAAEAGLSDRVHFEARDASAGLPRMDLALTFDVVHDAARPLELASAIHEALSPHGRWLAFEVRSEEDPDANSGPLTLVRWGFSLLYCMSVSLAQGGEGLGTFGLTESRMRHLCTAAGFSDVHMELLSFHVLYEVRP
ncbi:MAG: methyltransferase domain-containing protein [Myxococcales bacterium]|nr:methyltransferase domain-containing protein [Myxococcales bacterium]